MCCNNNNLKWNTFLHQYYSIALFKPYYCQIIQYVVDTVHDKYVIQNDPVLLQYMGLQL